MKSVYIIRWTTAVLAESQVEAAKKAFDSNRSVMNYSIERITLAEAFQKEPKDGRTS